MPSVAPGFSGGLYWDKANNKVGLDTNQRIDPNIYKQYVDYASSRQSNPYGTANFNFNTLGQQLGATTEQMAAMKKQYDVERYNANPIAFPDVEWNKTLPNTNYSPQYGSLFDTTPGVQPTEMSAAQKLAAGTPEWDPNYLSKMGLTAEQANAQFDTLFPGYKQQPAAPVQTPPLGRAVSPTVNPSVTSGYNPTRMNTASRNVQPQSQPGVNTSTTAGYTPTRNVTAQPRNDSAGMLQSMLTGSGNTAGGLQARDPNTAQQLRDMVANTPVNYSPGPVKPPGYTSPSAGTNMQISTAGGKYSWDPRRMTNVASGTPTPEVSPYVSNPGTTVPPLTTGSNTAYNPTPFAPNSTGGGGFIDSSGGFTYDNLPGMWNYLMQYLGENANQSSGVNNALTGFLGSNMTSQYPSGMSDYLQQLISTLGGGQLAYGTGMQGNAANTTGNLAVGQGTSTPIQNQATNAISQAISGGGLNPQYVQAMVNSVLKPALEDNYGISNQMGGGVGEMSSGLPAELARRTTSDFTDQLIKSGFENYNNLLGQGMNAGAQSFGQGLNLAGLQSNMGQQGISNTNAAMNQGQNLLGQMMQGLLGLQGNAQNYTTALSGQYGNLASNLLSNKTNSELVKSQQAQDKAGSIASLLGKIASGVAGSGGSGGSSNLPIQSAIDAFKKLLGIGGNKEGEQAIKDSANDPFTTILDIVKNIPTGGGDLAGTFTDDFWNSLFEGTTGNSIDFSSYDPNAWTWDNITNQQEPVFNTNWDDFSINSELFPVVDNYQSYPGMADLAGYGDTYSFINGLYNYPEFDPTWS
jgi:hypothetical protein